MLVTRIMCEVLCSSTRKVNMTRVTKLVFREAMFLVPSGGKTHSLRKGLYMAIQTNSFKSAHWVLNYLYMV